MSKKPPKVGSLLDMGLVETAWTKIYLWLNELAKKRGQEALERKVRECRPKSGWKKK